MRHGLKKMNKDGNVEENIIGFEALLNSMYKCKKHVIWKSSVAHCYLNGIEETLKLKSQLEDGTYKPRPTVSFTITRPKKRDIISIAFRDRVYQRSLNDQSIYPQMCKSFITANMACQKDKGTDAARDLLIEYLRRHYRKHGLKGGILQIDIKGYYPNMRHEVVEKQFKKHLDTFTYDRAVEVLRTQYEGDVGVNPGSQMVQIAGISVPDPLDHYIKEELHIQGYIRYMDDLLLIHEDIAYLKHCQKVIAEKLSEDGFTPNTKKTKIVDIKDGCMFLGFFFRLTNTGKVVMLLDPKKVKEQRKKLYRLVKLAKAGEITKGKADYCYTSWKAHASKGNNYKMLQRMDTYYKNLWKE